MVGQVPAEPYELSSMKVWALELFIILHMDHEQNASTSTVRTAGETAPIAVVYLQPMCMLLFAAASEVSGGMAAHTRAK